VTVRVRYAGSPSGDIHIGNMRTVLFNWLFARHEGGTFVWRVEDTDAERANRELISVAIDTFRWLGIDWDEGPEVGGPHEPYFQSERADLHRDALAKLESEGKLYRCTCTREDIKARGTPTGYDRHCRTHPPADGLPYALRFAVPEGRDVVVPDIIRGDVVTPFHEMQDFIVARADGSPTFVLANTVDDIAMEITHVIRAMDLLNAAASNVLLFEALGAPLPVFGHVPLVLAPNKSRLGARHGAVGTSMYRAAGYLPEALTNYLALLGWSHPEGKELLSRDELVELFTLDRLHDSGAIFDAQKLNWVNQHYVQSLAPDDLERRVLELFPDVPREVLSKVIELDMIQSRVVTLAEVPDAIRYLHERPHVDPIPDQPVLGEVATRLESLDPWTPEAIKEAIQGAIADLDLHRRKGPKPIFVAISGSERALPLFESIYLIGREESVARLRAATTG
jgi:glutamyl-tRNA synthetase